MFKVVVRVIFGMMLVMNRVLIEVLVVIEYIIMMMDGGIRILSVFEVVMMLVLNLFGKFVLIIVGNRMELIVMIVVGLELEIVVNRV